MTNKAHASLTGSDLHEPKGADTAAAGQVYISDGSGSGIWTDTGATIGTAAFTTGDLKLSIKTTAESGWILLDDGTIGDVASGATTLASSTAQDLFYLIWANTSNTWCPVSSGRGVSAAADWAAHKHIQLPRVLGRSLSSAGTGSFLTARALAEVAGTETHQLTSAQLPTITPTFSGTTQTWTLNSPVLSSSGLQSAPSDPYALLGFQSSATVTVTPSGTISSFGGNQAHNNMHPTSFFNVFMKL